MHRACRTGFVDTVLGRCRTHGVPLRHRQRASLCDTGSEAVVLNADRSKNMYTVRLKVLDGRITAIETIRANKGDAGRLWDPRRAVQPSGRAAHRVGTAMRAAARRSIGT